MYDLKTALKDFELPIVISFDNEYQSKMEDILNRFLVHINRNHCISRGRYKQYY